MKRKEFGNFALLSMCLLFMGSCGASKFMDMTAPEESGLNVMKITDESSNSVMGNARMNFIMKNSFAYSTVGGCKNSNIYWGTGRLLDISPDGTELAYVSNINKQANIMVRKSGPQSAATQRTFRNVNDFSWGKDGNLYFSDNSDVQKVQIGVTNAHSGSLMRQLTNNNLDSNPVVTKDGKILFFTRVDKSGPSIWSLNLEDGALTSCARGYNPSLIGDKNDSFICVRNSTAGVSEIWMVNYVEGKETLILSDKDRGFSNPTVSPDGEWILCQGNSKSSITKKNNLDLFAVKLDGTNFLQLTYHPADDCCPEWSADGEYIYFISSRANKNDYFNVWRMKFNL
ncbi:wD40-like protein [Bacteroides sp. CAG:661]|nr:wD40-like protein [Bacteroides sp. CAG:661]